MSVENAVLTKILAGGDMRTPTVMGVGEAMFSDLSARLVYADIVDYHGGPHTRGNVPSIDWVLGRHPTFVPADTHQDLQALCVELKEQHLKIRLAIAADNVLSAVGGDPMGAYTELAATIRDLGARHVTRQDVTFGADAIADIKATYRRAKEADGLLGIPYPWSSLTRASQGMQEGQFILFYGRPKSMKTWTLLNMGVHAYVGEGCRVLIFSWEQTPEELMRRSAAIMARVDYQRLKTGGLPAADEQRLWANLEVLSAYQRKLPGRRDTPWLTITTTRGDTHGGGVESLRHRIDEMRPDFVGVDGIYQMVDDRQKKQSVKWGSQSAIIQDLKGCALDFRIPIVATTQANRSGADPLVADGIDVAFADAAVQYADVLVKVYKLKSREEDKKIRLICKIVAAREVKDLIGWKMNVGDDVVMVEEHQYDDEQRLLAELRPADDQVDGRPGRRSADIDTLVKAKRIIGKNKWAGEDKEGDGQTPEDSQ